MKSCERDREKDRGGINTELDNVQAIQALWKWKIEEEEEEIAIKAIVLGNSRRNHSISWCAHNSNS